MKRCTSFLLVVSVLLYALESMAYEVDTHEKLSEVAAKNSILSADTNVLKNLGLPPSIENNNNPFPNSEGKPRNILNLIKDGSKFEDNFPRSLNHFYDPLTGFGLNAAATGSPSPDWALEDQGSYTSQDNSYKDARGYFYDALAKTGSTRAERDADWGKLFQSLGQIVHHIQDMAQPQHVRNDDHCDQWYCVGPFKNPSRYEKYTDLSDVRNSLPFTDANYNAGNPVRFPTARHFWTDNGRGLADFTNRNFVSAGTNYQLFNGNPVPGANYFEPIPSGFGPLVPIAQLFNEIGETTTLTGLVGFVENAVYDSRTGSTLKVKNAITRSYT